MVEGKLSFDSARKTWMIVFYNEKKKSDSTLYCRDKSQFSSDLNLDESLETEVEFERLPNGDPIKIRPKGQEWKNQEKMQTPPRSNFAPSLKGEFHNPYNFVPVIPRDINYSEFADREPSGHDRYLDDKFSGKLTVKMTVKTPLVVLDTARMIYTNDKGKNIKEHKSYPIRVDADGKPFINPTAVKGMLRSAYEAVTNSRLSVFTKHDDRLAFRSEAKLGAIPARVEKKIDGNFYFRVMKSQLTRLGFAAKLRRYKVGDNPGIDKGESSVAIKYNDGSLPKNGEAVWVQLNSKGAVEHIVRRNIGEAKAGWQAGWVCVTGANIDGKKNERVFLENPSDRVLKIEEKHINLWRELISNYQEIHQKDLAERDKREPKQKPSDYLGKEPGKTAWSRHIYEENSEVLAEGTLCYLNFKKNSETEIDAVIPVTISRRLFALSPDNLLNESLKPADNIQKLSPADRVFGCVIQSSKDKKKANAYRGQVRVGAVICQTEKEKAIQKFNDWLPLNILGQPKPQQGRFYVSENYNTGKSQIEKRNNEDAGYKPGRGLRGRKVYPHHASLPNDYWTIQNNLREYNFPKKEFIRPLSKEQRNSQNRSIEGWVNPGTEFTFDIHFTNLSEVELGALVWLLQLPEEHFHRFGGGKPYGFGSVRLKIIDSDVRDGKDLESFYMSLDDEKIGKLDENAIKTLADDFKKLADSMFPTIIKSFLRACEGFSDNKPIHYPRKRKELTAETKSFEWFVENNRIERGTVKNGYVLQDLTDDDGLPYLV